MELQSACCFQKPPKIGFTLKAHVLQSHTVSAQRVQMGVSYKYTMRGCKPLSGRSIVCTSDSNSNPNSKLKSSRKENLSTVVRVHRVSGMEPFHGKSGSVSFHGITHQSVGEGNLVSAPFKEGTGSFLWVLAPAAIISSLLLPQFFLANVVDAFIKDEILAELVSSLASEAVFYIGLATFLLVTDTVQKPYLQFSSKRWSLVTGLRGYLTSAFFTMGLKVCAPLFVVYVTWPVLGLSAVVAVAPFLVGCLVQFVFERSLDKRTSSSWPLVPIIFEVYRLYQLTKATHFIETLMLAMKGAAMSKEMIEKSGALVGFVVTFQVLGLVCLWSLMTFLLRLFPSRPVAENY